MIARCSTQCFTLVICLLSLGCGGGQKKESIEVSGVVTLEQKPVDGATVYFEGTDGRPISAQTDAEGKFTMKAAPGKYKVSITKTAYQAKEPTPEEMKKEEEARKKGGIPERYGSYDGSKLTAEVTDSGGNFKFELTK